MLLRTLLFLFSMILSSSCNHSAKSPNTDHVFFDFFANYNQRNDFLFISELTITLGREEIKIFGKQVETDREGEVFFVEPISREDIKILRDRLGDFSISLKGGDGAGAFTINILCNGIVPVVMNFSSNDRIGSFSKRITSQAKHVGE